MTATEEGSARSTAAVDDAIRRLRAAAAAAGQDDGPGAPGTADPDVVRTALATLPHDDQQLLWEQHVRGRSIEVVARGLGMHVRAAARRLRAAEGRLGLALSAAHTRGVPQRVCMETRGSLHDYVNHRLPAGRRQPFEDHLFGCAGCLRAFVDVREASWALRDAAPLLAGGFAAAGVSGPVVIGAAGAVSHEGVLGWLGPVGAGLVACWDWVVRGVRGLFGRPVVVAGGVGATAFVVGAVAMVGGFDGGPDRVQQPAQDPVPVVAESATPAPVATDPAGATPSSEPSEEPAPEPSVSPSDLESVRPDPGADPAELDPAPAPEPPATEEAEPPATEEPEPTSPDSPDPAATESAGPVNPDPVEPVGPVDPPVTTPSPTPEPAQTPTPEPTPTHEPEPATRTVTLEVEPWGFFSVATADGVEVTSVRAGRHVRAEQWWSGWVVYTRGARDGTVEVEVTGPPGADLEVRLVRWSER